MACIITYKGEEIPYEDWVQRLENGLLDELINDKIIDISEFKGEIKPITEDKKVTAIGDALSASSRFRPYETIVFKKPIIGKNGNELISYQWAYEWYEVENKEGEAVGKRKSDWTQAENSAETGRDIVHKFTVKKTDGSIVTVSSETIPSLLGYVNEKQMKGFPSLVNAVKTLAKQKMQLAIIEAKQKEYDDLTNKYRKAEKPPIEMVEYKDGVAVFKMGNEQVWQSEEFDSYDKESGKSVYKKITGINQERKSALEESWVSKRVEEDGAKKQYTLGDLKQRIERQEKKVQKLTEQETVELEQPTSPKQPTTQAEVKAKLIELGLTEEEAETSSRIYDVYVKNKAAKTGRSVEDVYGDIEFKGEDGQVGLMQMPNGEIVKAKSINADVVNGFYSPLEKVINETKFDKLPAKQWIDKFAKGEEAKWTGLNEWLSQQQGSVSKSDIQKYLKDNRIEVVEVVKGDSADSYTMEDYEKFPQEVKDIADEVGEDGMEFYTRLKEIGYDVDLDIDGSVLSFNKKGEENKFDKATKFSQYQLEGEKENYKEVLVTMPPKKREGIKYEVRELNGGFSVWNNVSNQFEPLVGVVSKEEAQKRVNKANEIGQDSNYDRKDVFQSSHFEEPNILVHLRMNTRTDANGNKVLFLEEVQGDFPQEYRKQQNLIDDYVDKNSAKVIEAFKKKGILEVICP